MANRVITVRRGRYKGLPFRDPVALKSTEWFSVTLRDSEGELERDIRVTDLGKYRELGENA